jgi:thiol-disulfide isomerase/thioredoxin
MMRSGTHFMKTMALAPLLLAAMAGGGTLRAAPPAAQQTRAVTLPASPLKTKKTIQTTALFSVWNTKTKKAMPFFAVKITVDGPVRYRIDATPLAMATQKPSFYFSDGVKQYEYNSVVSKEGVYKIQDAPKPGERPMSQLASMAGLELILTPDAEPRKNVTRTISEETIEGKKTVVVTDREPARKSSDGKEVVPFTRFWVETATGLPLRKLEGAFVNGELQSNLQLDFAKWTFDQPVPPKVFAWAVPEGAKSNTEPTLLANGTPAPDFTAYTPDGKPVKLSDYKGKVVVLDFWATWCGPCQSSMPHLEKIYRQVRDKDVVVLALCVWDEKDAYKKWVAAKKGVFSFPTLFDPAGRAENNIAKAKYQVTGIPTQYVIDKAGRIAASTIGYSEGQTFLEDTLAKFGVRVEKLVAAR